MSQNGISEEEKIAAERRKVCGKATDDLPLEENWARRVEQCLAISQRLGGEGRALETAMFLRPESSDRIWQSRVLMGGAVEISSQSRELGARSRVEWVYPPGTGFAGSDEGEGRMDFMRYAETPEFGLHVWLEGVLNAEEEWWPTVA
jgi:hypothetical protein